MIKGTKKGQLTKICKYCNLEKQKDLFRKNYRSCIDCAHKIAVEKWRQENPVPRQKLNTLEAESRTCTKCKETKSAKLFYQNGQGGYRGTCKYCQGYKDPIIIPEEIKNERKRKYIAKYNKIKREERAKLASEKANLLQLEYIKCKEFFKFKTNFTTLVLNSLKNKISRQEILKALPFSLDQLKTSLEFKFEPWMKWENYGGFYKDKWKENDINTWKWKILLKQNKEELKFESVNDESFKKYWSLDNLLPAKANFTFRDLNFVKCIDCKNILSINEFNTKHRVKRCKKCTTIFYKKYSKPKVKVILSEEEIQKKKEIKKQKSIEYHKIYRQNNKEKTKIWRKNSMLNADKFPHKKLRKALSNAIYCALTRNKSTKNNLSILKFLPYSMQELKEHLEKQFELWMSWDNWGQYSLKNWNDENISTWTWQIDHIVPHIKFQYLSMNCKEFLECWSLSNLRPLNSKENNIKNKRSVEEFELVKGIYNL